MDGTCRCQPKPTSESASQTCSACIRTACPAPPLPPTPRRAHRVQCNAAGVRIPERAEKSVMNTRMHSCIACKTIRALKRSAVPHRMHPSIAP